MQPPRPNDLGLNRPPLLEERIEKALALMNLGLRLQRQSLQQRFPEESEEGIQRRFSDWLSADSHDD